MYSQWFKTEHDRLHIIEDWPDGPSKLAALAAVRSAIASLLRVAPEKSPFDCEICLNRRRQGTLHFPTPFQIIVSPSTDLAA